MTDIKFSETPKVKHLTAIGSRRNKGANFDSSVLA
jgi:hypothetical protein